MAKFEKGFEVGGANSRVSICLPNLNCLRFLHERFTTILGQTFQDWELFVYDSLSDDGAWDLIQDWGSREKRLRAMQGPREGPYPAWNECLRQTKGEFVYIATSDDTMAPDCLEKMVSALDQHPECDLAHCPLVIIDETGAPAVGLSWPECTVIGDQSADLLSRTHVRRAPYDGLLHLMGRHVYYSITQLLIRRSLFSKIGDFPSKWGSASDFNWEMKAGLVANTVYVANTWASWRVHPGQLTAATRLTPLRESQRKVEEMIEDAVLACQEYLDPLVVKGLDSKLLGRFRELRKYHSSVWQRQDPIRRRFCQLAEFFRGGEVVRSHLISRIFGMPAWPDAAHAEIRSWLATLGIAAVTES